MTYIEAELAIGKVRCHLCFLIEPVKFISKFAALTHFSRK